jgi:hypothetical protein
MNSSSYPLRLILTEGLVNILIQISSASFYCKEFNKLIESPFKIN